MNWKIQNYNPEVTHVPTGRKVTLAGDSTSDLSTNVREVFGDYRAEIVEGIEKNLLKAYKEEKLRWDTAAIIRRHFNDDYNLAIKIIKKQTKKEVSLRTLQSWLIESGRISSRKCPEWALIALQDYIASHGDELQEMIKDSMRQKSIRDDIGAQYITSLIEKDLTKCATNQIEADRNREQYWQNTNYADLPTKIAKLEKTLNDYVLYHNKVITMILNIKNCNNYDDFRDRFIKEMQEYDFASFSIAERKAEIIREADDPS